MCKLNLWRWFQIVDTPCLHQDTTFEYATQMIIILNLYDVRANFLKQIRKIYFEICTLLSPFNQFTISCEFKLVMMYISIVFSSQNSCNFYILVVFTNSNQFFSVKVSFS